MFMVSTISRSFKTFRLTLEQHLHVCTITLLFIIKIICIRLIDEQLPNNRSFQSHRCPLCPNFGECFPRCINHFDTPKLVPFLNWPKLFVNKVKIVTRSFIVERAFNGCLNNFKIGFQIERGI